MGADKIMVWNYPTNITGLGSILVYANGITNGYMGTTLAVVYFAVVFFIIGANDRALITAAFTSTVISMMLNIMGVVDSSLIMIFTALTLVGMAWNWTKN